MAIQRLDLDIDRIPLEIGRLSSAEIDELPFGAIQLDEDGTVLSYNRFESQFAKRDRNDVVGRNFFRDIAPCTRVKSFFGAFQEGVRRKELDEVFDFNFKFAHGPKQVRVRMIYASSGKNTIWIFVTPIE